MSLVPCTGLVGTVTLIGDDPPIGRHRDILYVPTGRAKADAGLFDADGALVPAAATFRGGGPRVAQEKARNDLDATRFPYAPEDATYLFAGTFTGHYGHFLLTSLARLWALDRVERRGLRLVLLNHGPIATILAIPWLRALLETLDIGEAQLVNFPTPLRFREILIPGPAFEEQHVAHAAFARMTRAMGARLLAGAGGGPDRPVFLSRRRLDGGVNRIVNEQALCERLVARGIEIVDPETLPIAAQARLFADRRVVSGLAGSALHTSLFAPARPRIAINYVDFQLSNQPLIDRVTGSETLCLYPQDDIVAEGAGAGFDHRYRLHDPGRTADELADRIEALAAG